MRLKWVDISKCALQVIRLQDKIVIRINISAFFHFQSFIDNTQDRKMREKLNPFHSCFTLKTFRFVLAKLISIWIDIHSCWLSIHILKIPSKSWSFVLETDFIFLGFFDDGCCLLKLQIQHNNHCWKYHQFYGQLWIPLISWVHWINFHYFRGHTESISTNFLVKLWSPLISWTGLEVHLFRGHAALLALQ